jgi:hypothetical protein
MLKTRPPPSIIRVFDCWPSLAADRAIGHGWNSSSCPELDVPSYSTSLEQLSALHHHRIIYGLTNAVMFWHSAKKVHRYIRADTLPLGRKRVIYFGDIALARMIASEMSYLSGDHCSVPEAFTPRTTISPSTCTRSEWSYKSHGSFPYLKNKRSLPPEKVQKMKTKRVRPRTPDMLSSDSSDSSLIACTVVNIENR